MKEIYQGSPDLLVCSSKCEEDNAFCGEFIYCCVADGKKGNYGLKFELSEMHGTVKFF